MGMRLLAPAKINLHLRVGKRRGDGFHPLLTWMCTVGLFDTLTIETPAAGHAGVAAVEFDCNRPDLPRDEGNLVVRVAREFGAELRGGAHGGLRDSGRRWAPPVGQGAADASTAVGGTPGGRRGCVTPVRISLTKQVPVGAGLGGGSSDAARTLVGLDRLWDAGRAADDLSGFAARFGSDVPFFVAAAFGAPSAVCTGRGEVVRPVAPPAPKWALLVLPPFGLATREVYPQFDELGLGSDHDVADEPDWDAWAGLPARELLPRLVNDLEPAAFSVGPPALVALRADLERTLGRPVRMSGSGSSLFTLFDAAETDLARTAPDAVREANGVNAGVVELCPEVPDDLGSEARVGRNKIPPRR